jgi:dTDP-4-dehydrorhamnose 3,5-epimerase
MGSGRTDGNGYGERVPITEQPEQPECKRLAAPVQAGEGILHSRDDDAANAARQPVAGPRQGACLRFTPTNVAGAMLIDPIRREDERGYFARAWCVRELAEHRIAFVPVQANIGFSANKGTLRGIHFQTEGAPEAKLVLCTRGAIFDVVLDLRPDSPSYGKWHGVELSAENNRMLYIPEYCAHGYQVLEDGTAMYYLTSQYYTPSAARGVRFDDPAFGIEWPLPPTSVSEQDRNWPLVSGGRLP